MLLLCGPLLSGQEYRLIWKDDFRGRQLDSAKWSGITRGPADWRRYMSSDESLRDVRKGRLVLRAAANDGVSPSDTARFLTGGIYTKGHFYLSYGKVEIRARMQSGSSVWPALWMLPEEGVWPDGGEIDIMEHLNHDSFIYQTVHSHYIQVLGNKTDPPHSVKVPADVGKYNVYGVEILPDKIVFSVNGDETLTYPRISPDGLSSESQYPFGSPFYILLDMQIGGAWVGPPDASDLPVEMHVDWIKVYALNDDE